MATTTSDDVAVSRSDRRRSAAAAASGDRYGRSHEAIDTRASAPAERPQRRHDPAGRAFAGRDVGDHRLAERTERACGRRRPTRPGAQPTERSASATRSAIGVPRPRAAPCREPIRLLDPPVSTAPASITPYVSTVSVRDARRVELEQEQVASLRLVGLADRCGHLARARAANGGSRGSSAPTSARSRCHANRWRAGVSSPRW